ncbi:MAG: hypothetical protein IAF38_10475 [Bacteroidia bacterium]|nr:hypothetical protein [Bacteroidia bacterium]
MLKNLTYHLNVLLLLFALFSCKQKQENNNLPENFKQIQDRKLDNNELEKVIALLDSTVSEKSDFWLTIVNDSSYSNYHRCVAAMMFFKRHAKKGMMLKNIPPITKHLISDRKFVSEYSSKPAKRRIISRNGGSWKDVGHYFTFSELEKTDSTFKNFYRRISENQGNCFYLDLWCRYSFDMRGDPYQITGIMMGLKGDIDENELEKYLETGSCKNQDSIKLIDVYIHRVKAPVFTGRSKEDDL